MQWRAFLLLLSIVGYPVIFMAFEEKQQTPNSTAVQDQINSAASSYVKLVLALGAHDPDYVDAYFGPDEWKEQVIKNPLTLSAIANSAGILLKNLRSVNQFHLDEVTRLRVRHLIKQTEALAARVQMLQGTALSFDQESLALYDAATPSFDASHFEQMLDQLDQLLPGDGSLYDRYVRFRQQFQIATERIDPVFRSALAECRKRTTQHLNLPEKESFSVEYVSDKPWGGYNHFLGNGRSLIQLNTGLPIYIDSVIDYACHEGYPGHHVYNLLLEQEFVRKRNWVEFSVYPLFSPLALLMEGTANYGIEMAFPGTERIDFENRVLFPLAGLDPSEAYHYYNIKNLTDQLSYAVNEAARKYLDHQISREEAIDWLQHYAMMPPERARSRLAFIERYRSYVINYNLGLDLVRTHIELESGAMEETRWRKFEELITTPLLPSDL
jgi:hypothetical protein